MKNFIYSILVIFFSYLLLPMQAFCQGFSWANSFTGMNIQPPLKMACDANNNTVSCIRFTGTVDFDASASTYNLTSVGALNLCILKQDAAGNFIWAKQIAGSSSSVQGMSGFSITLDSVGNIYLTGSFRDSFDFDPGPSVKNLVSDGVFGSNVENIFILKLDSTGNFLWVRQMADPNLIFAAGRDVRIDKQNHIYLASSFSGVIDADPSPNTLTFNGGGILIHKLTDNGDLIWAKQIAGGGRIRSFAIDSLSNLYFTGIYTGTVDFDPGLTTYNLTANGSTALVNDFYRKTGFSRKFRMGA